MTASFHLEGEILQWFRWMDCTNIVPCWEDFTWALCREFGPSEFEDSAEALFKLRQTGTFCEYITKFRKLANRTSEVGPILLKSCFLGDLKHELKFDMKLLKPLTVHDAIAIAVQLDLKSQELKRGHYKPPNPTPPNPHVPNTPVTQPYAPRLPSYPIKKLSHVEIQLKIERGECWFCNDKWVKGHKCGLKQLLLLETDDIEEVPETIFDVASKLNHMELSVCAFYGTKSSQTAQSMKVQGSVNGHPVRILLDSGSTHNFVDSMLVKQWGQSVHSTKAFEVMIVDGGKVHGYSCCKSSALSIRAYNCTVDLFSLSLGGCDLVLGVQWLSTISPML